MSTRFVAGDGAIAAGGTIAAAVLFVSSQIDDGGAVETADDDHALSDAVGMPGMIDQAMKMAPKDSRILVVGVCMPQDHILPMVGVTRELSIQFVFGYTPEEFVETHQVITAGGWDLAPMITGTVTIDGVPQAFADLGNPDEHAKILVQPA